MTPFLSLSLIMLTVLGAQADALRQGEAAYQQSDYATAQAAFERFLTATPSDAAVDVARFRLGQIALAKRDFTAASDRFGAVAASESPLADRASYYQGLASYRAKDYGRADLVWSNTIRSATDESIAARAQFGRAWCQVRRGNWGVAELALDRVMLLFPDDPLASRAESMQKELSRANHLPRRSSSKAKWMSTILPGSGQIYAGHVGNGLVSAGLNGGMAYVLGSAVNDRRWLDVGFLYLLGSRFYFGGRQNADKFANEHNERVVREFVDELARFEQ